MAVEQSETGVIGYEIDVNSAETFDQDCVFENSGRFFSMNFGYLEIMPMQMKRMHVVALVDEKRGDSGDPDGSGSVRSARKAVR
jgi:hypothetical protein